MIEESSNPKRDQFSKQYRRRMPPAILIPAILIVIVGVAYTLAGRGPGSDEAAYFGDPVAEPRSYLSQVVPMTAIEPVVEDGWIMIPLELVSQHHIVGFDLENDEGFSVPLMAYITPSGRLFTGSSMCEPCRGRTFSLAGKTLLCDVCRTTYTIESHEFISGSTACGSYPPVYLEPVVENEMIKIPLAEVLEWRSRAY